MNTLFKANNEINRSRCDRIMKNAMIILVDIHQTNKTLSVITQPENSCKLDFSDNLWPPFFYQAQSNIVFFAINNFSDI